MHVVQTILSHGIYNCDAEDATWWDWSEIGGRWDGLLYDMFGEPPNPHPNNKNIIPFTGNQNYITDVLHKCAEQQQETFSRLQREASGASAQLADVWTFSLGPVTDEQEQESLQRLTDNNKENRKALDDLLTRETMPNGLRDSVPYQFRLLPLRTLLKLVNDEWDSESVFYDTLDYSSNVTDLLATTPSQFGTNIASIYNTGEYNSVPVDELYLQTVDFHY